MDSTLNFWLVLLLLVILGLGLLYYRFGYAPYQVFKKMGIPGPRPRIFWGNAQELIERCMIPSYHYYYDKFGPICGWYVGARPVLFIADIEMLKIILVKEFDSFIDREDNPVSLFNQFGLPLDLLQAQGETWRNARHLITPTFTSNKIKLMVPLIQDSCTVLVQKMKDIAESGNSADVWRTFGAFTLDSILSVAFGRSTEVQLGKEDRLSNALAKFFTLGRHSENEIMHPLRMIAISSHFPWLKKALIYLQSSRVTSDMKYLVDTAFAMIEERRHQNTEWKRNDFLQLLIDAGTEEEEENVEHHDQSMPKRRPLTDAEIVVYCITFLLAGYETTANALAFTAYLLATNPNVQDKLCSEIDLYFQEHPDASPSDVSHEVQYLDMALQETLRLYPPGARTFRHASKTIKVNDLVIPEGMRVLVPIIILHHSKAFWEDPEVFRPERFTPEEKIKRPQLCHMPFGWGPRNCIGMRFALMEAKMALAAILKEYKFVQTPDTEIPLKTTVGITFSPMNGVYVGVASRTHSLGL
eukprot:Em0006g977a